MTVSSIWTQRRLQHYVFRQIVEEWEDDIAAELRLPLEDVSGLALRASSRMGTVVRYVPGFSWLWDDAWRLRKNRGKRCALSFLDWPPSHPTSFLVQSDVIPIVLDFWRSHVRSAEAMFARSPLVFVTNIEIRNSLAESKLGTKLHYIPLSISDRYLCREMPEKRVDLIQVGRPNARMHEWALDYVRGRPSLDYVFAGDRERYTPEWISTKRGRLNIDNSRQSYIRLLQSARVSLVSAPGIDEGESRTGGFNPVTPRFYESAASRCHLVGLFPYRGSDFIENRVSSVCQLPSSQEHFISLIDAALSAPPDFQRQDDFLRGHLTTDIARLIKKTLEFADMSLSA